jgi:transcriptional regulator with XRE-family HTH domain
MDISKTIAKNLDAWMAATPALDTLKKVSSKSGVGFGTVRRARNGDGNTTIQNLSAIARALKRRPEDLLVSSDYSTDDKVTRLAAREPSPRSPLIDELIALAERMNERGQAQLIERAEVLAQQFPKAKANHSS